METLQCDETVLPGLQGKEAHNLTQHHTTPDRATQSHATSKLAAA